MFSSSTRFTVWSRSLCWNLGMHINQGWLILVNCLDQLLQSSGPLCACWHSGLVSSATEKFSFSSGAHNLICAPRFCLWHKCFLLFKIYDESTSCVFVTTDSQDSSPTPSVTFSLGYCKQLRSQHQSLGARHRQVCIDNLNVVVVLMSFCGRDLWVTVAFLYEAVVLKESQIISWLVNSFPFMER